MVKYNWKMLDLLSVLIVLNLITYLLKTIFESYLLWK